MTRTPSSRRLLALGLLLGALLVTAPLAGCGQGAAAPLPREAQRTVFLSHVLFGSGGRLAPNLQRRRAEQALELIRDGTSFEEVARAQSEDPLTREGGGFLGPWYGGREGMEALDGAAQMLAEGQTGGPVLSRRGWHVLRRHAYEEGRRLERERFLPMWGLVISWRELRDGADRSKEEAASLAQQLVQELRAGTTPLAEAKARYAPAFYGREDGWMGMLDRRRETARLFDALKQAPVDRFLDPLDTAEGFNIVKRAPHLRSVVRHILVQYAGAEGAELSVRLLESEAEGKARQALELARADLSTWDNLVARFSDEAATSQDGGSLGCVGPTELYPALEAAVLATPPGQVHPNPVKTPLGYHVLWRVD